MPDTYRSLLFVHVLAAVVWVGGVVLAQVLALRILRTRDAARIAGFVKDFEWVGLRLFLPSTIVIAVVGAALVERGDWGWRHGWLLFSIGIWLVSAVTGAGFFGPETGRIGSLIDAEGVESAGGQRRIRRLLILSRIEAVLLVAVLFSMVAKPGG
jgi:uncharacterized membrane protein